METSGEQNADVSVAIETVNQCNGGVDAAQLEKRLNSAVQKISRLTFAVCVLFVSFFMLCGICAFLYTEILQNRQEISRRCGNHGKDGPSDPRNDYLTDLDGRYEHRTDNHNETEPGLEIPAHDREKRKDKDDVSETDRKNKIKRKKTAVKEKPRRNRGLGKKLVTLQEIVKKVKRDVQNLTPPAPAIPTRTTTQKPQTAAISTPLPQQQNHFSHVAAAHYRSYVTNEYIQSVFPGDVNLGNAEAPVTLNVFREADWMSNVSSQQVFDMRNGKFSARHTGIYLVYAHVLFYDARTEQAIELVHEAGRKEANTFRCRQSQESITPISDIFSNTKYMACSINAVLYLKRGDLISVRNIYPNSSIDVTVDSTYFGALVFMNKDD